MLNTLFMFMQHRSILFFCVPTLNALERFYKCAKASTGMGNVYLFLPSDFVESVTKLKLIATAKQYAYVSVSCMWTKVLHYF